MSRRSASWQRHPRSGRRRPRSLPGIEDDPHQFLFYTILILTETRNQAAGRVSAERQLAEASSLWQTAAADGKLLRQRITILEEVRAGIAYNGTHDYVHQVMVRNPDMFPISGLRG